MRTLIISYDLAQPHRNKHILAQQIMAIGNSWARPLEQTWYVKTDAREEEIEAQLRGMLDPDDGLLIQATRDEAVLTNTALRWFRQRRAGVEMGGDTNVIAFPMPAQFVDDPAGAAPCRWPKPVEFASLVSVAFASPSQFPLR
ncbi:MAG: hypothetical protein WDN31_00215 [Hyphomicrobium sp.]